jgi:hypothetical protein
MVGEIDTAARYPRAIKDGARLVSGVDGGPVRLARPDSGAARHLEISQERADKPVRGGASRLAIANGGLRSCACTNENSSTKASL